MVGGNLAERMHKSLVEEYRLWSAILAGLKGNSQHQHQHQLANYVMEIISALLDIPASL